MRIILGWIGLIVMATPAALILFGLLRSSALADDYLDDLNTRAQIGSKYLGSAIYEGCPTPEIINAIRQQGEALGADYTEFSPVAGQENCPANIYGRVAPAFVEWEVDGIHVIYAVQGVTVGHFFKVAK